MRGEAVPVDDDQATIPGGSALCYSSSLPATVYSSSSLTATVPATVHTISSLPVTAYISNLLLATAHSSLVVTKGVQFRYNRRKVRNSLFPEKLFFSLPTNIYTSLLPEQTKDTLCFYLRKFILRYNWQKSALCDFWQKIYSWSLLSEKGYTSSVQTKIFCSRILSAGFLFFFNVAEI